MATLADQQTSTEMTIEFDPPALGSLIDERRAIRLSQSGHHRSCVMSLRRKPFSRRFAMSPNRFQAKFLLDEPAQSFFIQSPRSKNHLETLAKNRYPR